VEEALTAGCSNHVAEDASSREVAALDGGGRADPLDRGCPTEDVLVAVAPIVGTPRTAAAAAKIVEALELAIELALGDAGSAQDT
jgi:hypothetical protein